VRSSQKLSVHPQDFEKSTEFRRTKTPRFNLDLYLRVPQRRTIFLSLNVRFYASHINLHSLRNLLNFLTKLSSRTSRTNLHTNSQKSKVERTYSKQNVTCRRNLSHQSDSIDILFDGCSFDLSIIRIHVLAGVFKTFSVDTHTKDTTTNNQDRKRFLEIFDSR